MVEVVDLWQGGREEDGAGYRRSFVVPNAQNKVFMILLEQNTL